MYLVPPSIYDIRVYYSARIFTASRYDILVYYGARIFTGMFTPSTAKVCLPYFMEKVCLPHGWQRYDNLIYGKISRTMLGLPSPLRRERTIVFVEVEL